MHVVERPAGGVRADQTGDVPPPGDLRGVEGPTAGRVGATAARLGTAAAVAGIAGAAAAFRLVALPGQPGGLHPDEAAEGVDALRLLHQPGFHPIFFDSDGGREGLFAYLVALAFRIGGASVGSLRATAAVIGVLAVLATGFAVLRFGRAVALVAMAWAAGSVWLISVSRDGFRTILVPLVGALALWALLNWSTRPGRAAAMVAGAACGAGLWTYQPLKLLPLMVVVWLLWLWRAAPPAWERLRPGIPWAVGGYLLVAAPMLATALIDPVGYFGRGAQVSPHGTAGLPLHVLRTLGMFGVVGDPNPRHDAGGLPLLTAPLALLAGLGLVAALRRRRDPAYALLPIGTALFLLPPLVAVEGGAPHFLRSLGLAPYVAGLVGLGCVEAVSIARRLRPAPATGRAALAAAAFCGAALLHSTVQGSVAYFARPAADRADAYSFDLTALAAAARAPGSTAVVDPYQAMVVSFLDWDAPPTIVAPGTPVPAGAGPVFAVSRTDLAASLGPGVAARPVTIEQPEPAVVWRVDR